MFVSSAMAGEAPLNLVSSSYWFDYIDRERLERALASLSVRHESLRVSFLMRGDKLLRHVADSAPVRVSVITDCSPDDAELLARRLAATPFDAGTAPLMRVQLASTSDGPYLLSVVSHHLISDSATFQSFAAELERAYEALDVPTVNHEKSQAPTHWQGEDQTERDITYWTSLLADVPLHNDLAGAWRPGPRYNASRHTSELDSAVAAEMDSFCKTANVSRFALVLSVWAILLSKHTGVEAIAVAVPLEGRSSGDHGRLGLYVNNVLIPVSIRASAGLTEIAKQVQRTVLRSLRHQRVPFEQVLQRLPLIHDRPRSAPFQLSLKFEDEARRGLRLGGSEGRLIDLSPPVSEFDLTLTVWSNGVGFGLEVMHLDGCVDAVWAAHLPAQYCALISGLLKSPDEATQALSFISDGERKEVLRLASGPTTAAKESGLATRFRLVAEKHPDRVAVRDQYASVTFKQLLARSEQVRQAVINSGSHDFVGLLATRSADAVAGMIGILAAGAAYVPMDPAYPRERLQFCVEETGLSLVLDVAGAAAPRLEGVKTLSLGPPSPSAPSPGWKDRADSPAYVLYTSGSSGRPKGVMIRQEAVASLIDNASYAELNSDTVFLHVASLSFDASVIEVWGPLLAGGEIAIVSNPMDLLHRPARTFQLMGVTHVSLISSQFHAIVDRQPESLASVSRVLIGGELLDRARLRKARSFAPATMWVHCYGPTEACLFATTLEVEAQDLEGEGHLSIGRPIADTTIFVLDQARNLLPFGFSGELFISGPRIAAGYLRRPNESQRSFVENNVTGHGMMYATGDRGRVYASGQLELLGRMDRQVKVRGHRVELQEVESAMFRCPGVQGALAELDSTGRLIGFVAASENVKAQDVVDRCCQILPSYAVPSLIYVSNELAMTVNGKVDQTSLKRARENGGVSESVRRTGPRTRELERRIALAWNDVLGEWPDPERDFFAAGGTSLLALQMQDKLEAIAGLPLPLSTIFEARTPASMTDFIKRGKGNGVRDTVIRLAGASDLPTLCCTYAVGGHVENYRPMAALVEETFSTIGVLAPSFAMTRTADPDSQYVLKLIAEMGRVPRVLLGWSFGSISALSLLGVAPKGFFDYVVLVDPPRSDGQSPVPGPEDQYPQGDIEDGTLRRARELVTAHHDASRWFSVEPMETPMIVLLSGDRPDLASAQDDWASAQETIVLAEDHFAAITSPRLVGVLNACRARA